MKTQLKANGLELGGIVSSTILIMTLALAFVISACGGSADQPVTKRAESITIDRPQAVSSTAVAGPVNVVAATEPAREITFEEARTAYDERRYDDAVDLFTLYADQTSDHAWGHYMLGLSAWKAGDLETAETALRTSLEHAPRHVKTYVNLGRVYLDNKSPTSALETIETAVVLDLESGEAHRVRGRALNQLGQPDDAIAAYQKAILINENDAWSINNMALVLIQQERFDEALVALARAVELRDNVAVFQNNLGIALEATGHYTAAAEAFTAAVDINGYEKAAANLERVEKLEDKPDLEPVDMVALSQQFVEQTVFWSEDAAGIEPADMIDSDSAEIEVSETDAGSTEIEISEMD